MNYLVLISSYDIRTLEKKYTSLLWKTIYVAYHNFFFFFFVLVITLKTKVKNNKFRPKTYYLESLVDRVKGEYDLK